MCESGSERRTSDIARLRKGGMTLGPLKSSSAPAENRKLRWESYLDTRIRNCGLPGLTQSNPFKAMTMAFKSVRWESYLESSGMKLRASSCTDCSRRSNSYFNHSNQIGVLHER